MQNLASIALSDTLRGLRGELSARKFAERAPRCMVAVMATALAIYLARWLGLHEIWWSAVCAFAITGQDMKTSLNQGTQQMLGTLGGTAFGAILANHVGSEPGLFVLSITCIAATGLYLATSRASSYMWILSTSLAIYVIVSNHASVGERTTLMAETLSWNAIVGSAAYWGVNRVFNRFTTSIGLPSASPVSAFPSPPSAPFDVAFLRKRNVFAGTLTTSILAYFAYRYPADGFAQAMTTALVILVVPLDIHRDRSMYMVAMRLVHRLLGCLLGSVIACVVLPVATDNMLCCAIALCFAIWFSCHLRFGDSSIAYAGTQFGAVVILAFVHDSIWFSDEAGLAYARLAGIVSGAIALTVVLVVVGSLFSYARFARTEAPKCKSA